MSGKFNRNKKSKKNEGGFGAALINSRMKSKRKAGQGNHGPTKYQIEDTQVSLEDKLRSRTDDYTLGDFITDAELNGNTFNVLRGQVRIVDRQLLTKEAYNALHKTAEQVESENRLKSRLRIPRRPEWDEKTTPEELHDKETQEFLEWRRSLAIIEEDNNITLSPFEKNPEVWKELWRVIERSQVVVYILDGRDPLSYFCDDFVRYIHEDNSKPLLLAINKGDLVPAPIRDEWAKYFDELRGKMPFEFAFFSTKTSSQTLLSPNDIIIKAKKLAKEIGRDGKVTIGFVGFPNVGKSSLLNAAVGRQVCKSSSTPGKTKHLQTFNIEELGVTLCDCPGLVFPLFQQSRASMLCNGILNIDQLQDHIGPATIVCERIPVEALNALYGCKFTKKRLSAAELLDEIARTKGFSTGQGNFDQNRACKVLLKDYTEGKLIHCELPPGVRLKGQFAKSEPIVDGDGNVTFRENTETDSKESEQEADNDPSGKGEEKVERKIDLDNLRLEPDYFAVKKPGMEFHPKRRGVVRITNLE